MKSNSLSICCGAESSAKVNPSRSREPEKSMHQKPYRAIAVWLAFGAMGVIHAQTPPEALPPGTRATQLPLSGRTGETGSVTTVQNPTPGGTESVNTINSTIQVQGPFQGSVPTGPAPGPAITISLDDAIRRGLQSNLGTVSYTQAVRLARGEQTVERSYLLPNISAGFTTTEQQTDLAALGFSAVKIPGFSSFPTVIGPYHYFDLRAGVTQSILDLTRKRNYQASKENVKANQFSAQDARDLVVLAVTGTYLQIIASRARVDAARAQVATAQTAFQQATDQHNAGVAARIDVTRSQVELQTQQQRLTSIQNDLGKQLIAFGRLIGLPPAQDFTLSDTVPFTPLTDLTIDQALYRAYANRADLKAAESQIRAADLTKQAARAQRLPTVQVSADYGVIGTDPTSSHGTFAITGSVRYPIWQGNRSRGDEEQADAALEQRRAEYQDLRGRIDADVRSAFLDLNSAATQVQVAQSNRQLANETLTQARDRFAAGVTDNLEVVQAQESVATAEQDYISSLFAHNLAKTALARAMGQADQNIKQFLGKP
jgi:outer membrane protein TolC